MTLTRRQLIAWLNDLAQGGVLVAPRRVSGVVLYQPVEDAEEIVLDYIRPAMSPKEAFFPPTERLFTIHKEGAEVSLSETLPDERWVVFGVRPCDARGMIALDALFLEKEPVDSYYARRRENTVVVGLACREKGPYCFCDRLGGALDDPRGMDIMLREINGSYAVHLITEKGARLLPGTIEPTLPTEEITTSLLDDVDWAAAFEDGFWMQVSEGCLSCRICAYVCPTCRCFDVRDEPIPGNASGDYERLRCWDSCARDAYRRIAGGHNPRPSPGERLRNRFLCKFYYYSQQYDAPLACTGCGRCVEACPVNIDITEVLEHLQQVKLTKKAV